MEGVVMADMVPCPACGTPNSARKRVCHQCQAELPSPPVTPVPVTAPRAAPAGDAAYRPVATSRRTHRQRLVFYRQLQSLLHAGMPVGQCLQTMIPRVDAPLRPMLRELAQTTQDGTPLSTLMTRYPAFFPPWEVFAIHAAEVGGTLAETTLDLATMLEAEMEMRSRAGSQTLWLRLTGSLMVFVIFLVIQSRRSVAAGNVIDTPEKFAAYIMPVIVAVLIVVVLYWLAGFLWTLVSRTPRGGAITRALMRRTPWLGQIIYDQQRFRFLHILSTLWRAGVAPLEAIETAARACGDPTMLERIEAQLDAYSRGRPLSGLLTATGAFPEEAIYLLQTGETSGSVPEMLNKVAQYLKVDLDYRMRVLPTRLQFALYLIIAPCVGYLFVTTWKWFYLALIDSLSRLSQ